MTTHPVGRTSPVPLLPLQMTAIAPPAQEKTERAVKRTFEQAALGASETEGPVQKRARLMSDSNAFIRRRPQHKNSDRMNIVEIEVQIGEGRFEKSFVQKSVLTHLSDYFKTAFTLQLTEGRSESMKWIGPSERPNIHPEAAAYILEFAHAQSGIVDEENCWDLAKLKGEFPDQFDLILEDIIRLSYLYEIDAVITKCVEFLGDEFKIKHMIPHYFQWAFFSGNSNFFISALMHASANFETRMNIYSEFIALNEADYSECTKEEVDGLHRYIRQCCVVFIQSSEDYTKGNQKELAEMCRCVMGLYPRMDFPESIQKRLAYPRVGGFGASNPFSYYVITLFTAISMGVPGGGWGGRPQAEGKLKEFELLTEALCSPFRINSLSEFLSKYPENIFAMRLLAVCYCTNKQYDLGMPICQRILQLNPDFGPALELRALIYEGKRDYDAALNDINRAIEFRPDDHLLLALRGRVLRKKGDFDAALLDFDKAYVLKSDDADVLVERGICHRMKGNFPAAIHDLTLATYTDTNKYEAWLELSICHLQQGNLEPARVNVESALMRSPNHPKALELKRVIMEKINNKE